MECEGEVARVSNMELKRGIIKGSSRKLSELEGKLEMIKVRWKQEVRRYVGMREVAVKETSVIGI